MADDPAITDTYSNHLDSRNFTWAGLREHLIVTHNIKAAQIDDPRWVDVHARRHHFDVVHEEVHGG
jgi:hypothetical protein